LLYIYWDPRSESTQRNMRLLLVTVGSRITGLARLA
jgi:hypothetical protein